MPWFEYDGLTSGKTAIAGRIEADDCNQAHASLGQMGIDIRQLQQASPPARDFTALSESDFLFFNEQLASLAQAGIALDEGLAQLARDLRSSRLRGWIEAIVGDLRQGVPIDQALARREGGLPVLYSRVVKAGIDSGELPATLLNLNQHLRLMGQTRRMLWEIATYPILVLLMALSIASFFFGMVVPQFRGIFTDFNTRLPSLTVLLLDMGTWFTEGRPPGWMVIWGVPVLVAVLWTMLHFWPGGRRVRERIMLVIPVVGQVYRASLVARFLRSVATAVASGLPLPQAMRLSGDATGSRLLSRDAEYLAIEVERGNSIFNASKATRIIPSMFGFCAQVATSRDILPVAVGQLALAYENRAVHAQSMLRVYLLPLLLLVVGAILGLIIVSMFLPLVSLVNSVSGGGS